jgi:hypothetical protein
MSELELQPEDECECEREHPVAASGNVRVTDTVGVVFLGILALALLIALLRSQSRLNELLRNS